jgi:hypothetical protein
LGREESHPCRGIMKGDEFPFIRLLVAERPPAPLAKPRPLGGEGHSQFPCPSPAPRVAILWRV